jgi:transketolase
LDDADGTPDIILIASGSELSLAVGARDQLAKQGVKARVVSMPSWELFEAQPSEYRDRVLPPHVTARVAVELHDRLERLDPREIALADPVHAQQQQQTRWQVPLMRTDFD